MVLLLALAIAIAEDAYQELMNQVQAIKEKYNDIQYLRITGFAIDLSVSPEVTVDFEFKE